MHIFLQGDRGIGKSTVIRRTLDMLESRPGFKLGGFFTWNGGADDPNIYMRAAQAGSATAQASSATAQADSATAQAGLGTAGALAGEGVIHRVAAYDASKRRMVCDTQVFETFGAQILLDSAGADLIIMDELGYLESSAEEFKKAVMETLAGHTPVLGVLRLGDVPWHESIKNSPRVKIFDVNEETRGMLPQVLTDAILVCN